VAQAEWTGRACGVRAARGDYLQYRRGGDYVQKHGRHAWNQAGPPPQATAWQQFNGDRQDFSGDRRRGAERALIWRLVSKEPGEIGPPGGFSQSCYMGPWGTVRQRRIFQDEPGRGGCNRATFDPDHWGLIRHRKNQAILIRLRGVVRRFLLLFYKETAGRLDCDIERMSYSRG